MRGQITDKLQSVYVTGWTGGQTFIDIAGNGAGARIGPVRAVAKTSASGFVSLMNLQSQGNFGESVASGDGLLTLINAPVYSNPDAPYSFFVQGPVVVGCEVDCD